MDYTILSYLILFACLFAVVAYGLIAPYFHARESRAANVAAFEDFFGERRKKPHSDQSSDRDIPKSKLAAPAVWNSSRTSVNRPGPTRMRAEEVVLTSMGDGVQKPISGVLVVRNPKMAKRRLKTKTSGNFLAKTVK